MKLETTVAPALPPVTLAEAKTHAKITITDTDAEVTRLVSGATNYLEKLCGVRMVSQTVVGSLDEFPDDDEDITIPIGPVSAVASVKYKLDGASEFTTLPATEYAVDTKSVPARIRLREGYSWPTDDLEPFNGVEVTFTAGWPVTAGATPTTTTPEEVKLAVLLLFATYYEHREEFAQVELTPIPLGVMSLMGPYRRYWGLS